MLQAIRGKTASIVVKALAGLLIISFAAWGVGDFITARATDVSVATVGKTDIEPQALEYELSRETQRLRQAFGGQLSEEQLLQFGIGDAVLQRLINDQALLIKAGDLGIKVSDEQVTRTIHNDPSFHGFDGKFSRARFNEVIRNNGFSEAAFIERVRGDIASREMLGAIAAGGAATNKMASLLRTYRYEQRTADILLVRDADEPAPGTPTDEDLKALHSAQAQRFTAPEYRKITVVHLDPKQLMETVSVSDEDLKATFEANAASYIKPEIRTVQQMVLGSEEKAKEAEKRLAEGQDFVKVATEVAEMEAAAVSLGAVGKDGLLPEIADAVFAVKEGAVTAPVKTALGWHILRAEKVQAGETKTLDQVRDQVREIAAHEKAIDALYGLSVKFEDAIGGGSSLEEAAGAVGMKPITIDAVDRQGKTPAGTKAAGLPDLASLLPVAFSSEERADSPLTEAGDKGFFMVRVDKITPPALRPLETVRDEVAAVWIEQQRVKSAEKHAQEMVDLLNAGTTFPALAASVPGDITVVGPVTRKPGGDVDATVVARMFELKPGTAGLAKVANGYFVVRVTTVTPPTSDKDAPSLASIDESLDADVGRDLSAQMLEAFREEYGVKVNQRVFEAVLKPGIFNPQQFN